MTGTPGDENPRQEEAAREGSQLFSGPYRREVLSWMEEHQPELRRSAFGDRLLYQSIGFCLAVGMVAYIGGYVLRSSSSTEPLAFLGDLLYTLGYALWTGAVVVALLEVVPRVKQRQFRQMLQAYEGAKVHGSDRAPADPDSATRDGEERSDE